MKAISCVVPLVMFLMVFASCKKSVSTDYDARFRGTMQIEFDNVVGSSDLKLSTGSYTNAAGETYNVRSLRYFISNIVLVKTDGSEYVVPQDSSYFLIDESLTNNNPTLLIPEGEYRQLNFMLGVDSLRSTMELSQRKGVLSPTVSTYIDENSGYVFLSMDGNAAQAPQNRYQFQIAGYGGKITPTINNIKNISLDLTPGGIVKIREGKSTIVHIMADIAKIFTGTVDISLAQNNIILFDPFSVNVANNYALMFSHDHTHMD